MMFRWFSKTEASDDWQGPYEFFTESEMSCRCGCGYLPKHSCMIKLVSLRKLIGPLQITSGARCASYNRSIGGGPAHTAGVAADILASGWKALCIIICGYVVGFRGFGVKQHGDHSQRFIHVDCYPDTESTPRPTLWSYR